MVKQEQEMAYIIFPENVEDVANDFTERNTLGGFKLGKPKEHEIDDTYYDTPNADLRMSTVSLRARVIDGDLYVTFKGKEDPESDFTQDHRELEFPWPESDLSPHDLADVAGLVKVQNRKTNRITRKLMDEDGERIGEVCFDNSLYTVPTGQARIFELEVENQSDLKFKKIVKSIEDDLPGLLPWRHGKFVTGKAIEFAFGVKANEKATLDSSSFGYLDLMFKQLKVK